jgi:predicted MPP superfamily phosphohydrolase
MLRSDGAFGVSFSLASPLFHSSDTFSVAIAKAPPLHFSHDGHFKILQVADLHFSVARGKCRDTDLSPCVNSDNLTSTLIDHVLDAEKPDMVVFTGDQLNGQGTSWDSRSVLAKFAKTVIAKQIPWVGCLP